MAQTVKTATIVITGKFYVDDEYSGYSAEDLETELSMALDDVVNDISSGRPLGTLTTFDVSLSNLVDEEVVD